MAQQTLNLGATSNDGTGDQLRTAGQKINDNFTELYEGQLFQITADTTFYVRTDGNDSNDGTSNTPGGAWQTIQYAMNWCAAHLVVWSNTSVIIQLGNGTYTGNFYAPRFKGAGKLVIRGDVATPANVVTTSVSGVATWEVRSNATLRFEGITFSGTGHMLRVWQNGTAEIDRVRFTSTAGGSHMLISHGGTVDVEGNYTIAGSAICHWQMDGCGSLRMFSRTVTLTGTPAWTNAFAQLLNNASVYIAGNTFSGAATGARYAVFFNSSLNTNGAGINHLPGNAAGSTATGGQYG